MYNDHTGSDDESLSGQQYLYKDDAGFGDDSVSGGSCITMRITLVPMMAMLHESCCMKMSLVLMMLLFQEQVV